jgi:glycerate dehydrogenase
MRIVVLDGYTLNPGDNPWDDVAALGELVVHDRTPEAAILERAKGAEILLTNKTPLTAGTLGQLDALKFISVLATGYNVVDTEAARSRGVPVSNVPVYGTDSVAQFVFALVLHHCHNVAHHSAAVKSGEWERRGEFCFWDSPLAELRGRTMGLVGFGRIGQRTGEVARAFGMEVIAYDVVREVDPGYPFGWRELEELFAEADIVSLHCPLTAENEGLVNREVLERMKPGAFLVNTARGLLVNEQDLADALNSGRIAGAACDVVSCEPIAADSPLLTAKNITLTPHIAWATLEARKRLMQTTAENVRAFLEGTPINVVNG